MHLIVIDSYQLLIYNFQPVNPNKPKHLFKSFILWEVFHLFIFLLF